MKTTSVNEKFLVVSFSEFVFASTVNSLQFFRILELCVCVVEELLIDGVGPGALHAEGIRGLSLVSFADL